MTKMPPVEGTRAISPMLVEKVERSSWAYWVVLMVCWMNGVEVGLQMKEGNRGGVVIGVGVDRLGGG